MMPLSVRRRHLADCLCESQPPLLAEPPGPRPGRVVLLVALCLAGCSLVGWLAGSL